MNREKQNLIAIFPVRYSVLYGVLYRVRYGVAGCTLQGVYSTVELIGLNIVEALLILV